MIYHFPCLSYITSQLGLSDSSNKMEYTWLEKYRFKSALEFCFMDLAIYTDVLDEDYKFGVPTEDFHRITNIWGSWTIEYFNNRFFYRVDAPEDIVTLIKLSW